MTNKAYAETLKNCASMLADGIKYMKEEHQKQFKEAYEKAIESLEPQEGEWLPPDEFFDTKIWRKCSNCGINIDLHPKYISFGGEVHYSNRVSNYCPNCGAKMKGDEE